MDGESADKKPQGFVERRKSQDRRSMKGAFRLAAGKKSLRRKSGRRAEDHATGYYTDRHDAPLLLVAMSVLLFSALDSIFTLQLVARGAEELNPFLKMLMEIDVNLFAWGKMAITAVVLVVLVSHANYVVFGKFRIRTLLLFSLGFYVCLIIYQVGLLTLVEPIPDIEIVG